MASSGRVNMAMKLDNENLSINDVAARMLTFSLATMDGRIPCPISKFSSICSDDELLLSASKCLERNGYIKIIDNCISPILHAGSKEK